MVADSAGVIDVPEAGPDLRAFRAFAGNAGWALVGVAAALFALSALPELPTRINVERRRAAEFSGRCQVLFVGPSYVKAQVLPDVFDAEAKRIGLPLRSCKFGATGLRSYELVREMSVLLERAWPALELVVFDVTLGARPDFEPQNWFKPRMIQWHTFGSLPFLYRRYRELDLSLEKQLSAARLHGAHVASRYLHLGEGLLWVEEAEPIERMRAALEGRVPRVDSERKRLEATWQRYAKRTLTSKRYVVTRTQRRKHFERVAALSKAKRESPRYQRDLYPRELRVRARTHGLEAYFLVAPLYRAAYGPATRKGDADPLVVMDFCDPERFPEVYAPETRARTNHLNREGATHYSKLLAREILRVRSAKR